MRTTRAGTRRREAVRTRPATAVTTRSAGRFFRSRARALRPCRSTSPAGPPFRSTARAEMSPVAAVEVEPVGEHHDTDMLLVNAMVVVAAHGHAVVDRRRPSLREPPQVMHLAPRSTDRAARPLTLPVTRDDGSPKLLGVRSLRLSDVHRQTTCVHHQPRDLAVAHQPLELAERNDRSVFELRRWDVRQWRNSGPATALRAWDTSTARGCDALTARRCATVSA